jgi:hypothetical protein
MAKKWKTTGLGDLDITEMGGKFYFHYPLYVISGVDLPLLVESKVLFKLEDGKMVELSPTKLVTPEMKTWGYSLITKWNATFEVSTSDIQALGASRLVAIKLPLAGEQVQVLEFDEYYSKKLPQYVQQIATCVVDSK